MVDYALQGGRDEVLAKEYFERAAEMGSASGYNRCGHKEKRFSSV